MTMSGFFGVLFLCDISLYNILNYEIKRNSKYLFVLSLRTLGECISILGLGTSNFLCH